MEYGKISLSFTLLKKKAMILRRAPFIGPIQPIRFDSLVLVH